MRHAAGSLAAVICSSRDSTRQQIPANPGKLIMSPTISPPAGHCICVGIELLACAVVMCSGCVQKLTFMGWSCSQKLCGERRNSTDLGQPAFVAKA